eukprot:scaffold10517_cov113-Isochrysis_galbana.AAC.3
MPNVPTPSRPSSSKSDRHSGGEGCAPPHGPSAAARPAASASAPTARVAARGGPSGRDTAGNVSGATAS